MVIWGPLPILICYSYRTKATHSVVVACSFPDKRQKDSNTAHRHRPSTDTKGSVGRRHLVGLHPFRLVSAPWCPLVMRLSFEMSCDHLSFMNVVWWAEIRSWQEMSSPHCDLGPPQWPWTRPIPKVMPLDDKSFSIILYITRYFPELCGPQAMPLT